MSLLPQDHVGLINSATRGFIRNKWTSLLQESTSYVIFQEFLRRKKKEVKAGWGIEWNVITDGQQNTEQIGLYEPLTIAQTDYKQPARLEWGITRSHWSSDELELDMNSGSDKLYDLAQAREYVMMQKYVEHVESQGWNCPITGDNKSIKGIFYWLFTEKMATGSWTNFGSASNGGFLNVNRTEFSSGPAGLSAVTYPQWGCYNHQYVNPTDDDMGDKLRKAMDDTDFEPPIPYPDLEEGPDQRVLYCSKKRARSIEKIVKGNNDQLGFNMDPTYKKAAFRSLAISRVPYFDSSVADEPILGINWATLYPIVGTGWYMKRRTYAPTADRPTVATRVLWSVWQFKCCRRDKNFILSQ